MPDESRPDLAALTLSVRRVFGEPYEVEGTLVVPVGKVIGSYGLAAATGDARLGLRRPHHDAYATDAAPADGDGPEGGPGPEDGAAGADGGQHGAHAHPGDHDHPGPHGGPAHWHAPHRPGPGRRSWPFAGVRPSGRGGGQADSGGYAVRVKPLGVYVIRPDGDASWQPALDLNRVVLGGQAVGAVVGVAVALAWAVTRLRR